MHAVAPRVYDAPAVRRRRRRADRRLRNVPPCDRRTAGRGRGAILCTCLRCSLVRYRAITVVGTTFTAVGVVVQQGLVENA